MTDYIGQKVDYKDSVKLRHTSVIVGMTDDKQWYLVKSDKPTAPKADWHFKVKASEVKDYLAGSQ